jgi:hypothetical protein
MFADVVAWLRDPEVFVCGLREAGHALRAVEMAAALPVGQVPGREVRAEADGTRHWLGVEDRLRAAFGDGTLA